MSPLFVAAEYHNTCATAPVAFASCACQLIARNAVGGKTFRSAGGYYSVFVELPRPRIVQRTSIFHRSFTLVHGDTHFPTVEHAILGRRAS
jgi:hypothetical protein